MKRKPIPQQSMKVEDSLRVFEPLLSASDYTLMKNELNHPVRQSIRLNTLKSSTADLECWCDDYGWKLSQIPYCATGFWIDRAAVPPSRTPEHTMGKFYIQDAASMLPVELFTFTGLTDPLILDMAASPGGKTTHLCCKTGDQGLVIANDSSRARIQALRIVLQNWGSINQAITRLPGSYFGSTCPGAFDLVLLDAPCSMQGLRYTERHAIRSISANEHQALVRRQVELLESGILSAKINGQIVYSTCTLSPEENEGVINAVLDKYKQKIRVENISTRLGIPPALTSYDSQAYDRSVAGAARIWPHTYGTAGFFTALISKLGALEVAGKNPFLPPEKIPAPVSPAHEPEAGWLWGQLSEFVSCSFSQLLAQTGGLLGRTGDAWFLLPRDLSSRFPQLPVLYTGMLIAEVTPDGVLPSHEFLSRFSKQLSEKRIILEDEEAVAGWMKGQDLHMPVEPHGNPYILVVNSRGDFLGRGKCSNNRIRNLLPRHLI